MARIVVVATWHRRCGPYWYADALRRLGHDVVTVGPWREEEPWGERGREPQARLIRHEPPHYTWEDCCYAAQLPLLNGQQAEVDQVWLIDGGEDLRLMMRGQPPWPFVHISTEGSHMDWSRDFTPLRYAEIMCNGADAGVAWLPKAAPATWVPDSFDKLIVAERPYDLVQLASPRASRCTFWQRFRAAAPELNCVFGELWGPLYWHAHYNSLATWVCSNQDFVTARVFEAMALGCIVFADRTPAMLSLFQDGVDFIGYDAVVGADGEGAPDPHWLRQALSTLRGTSTGRLVMARSAWQKIAAGHTMDHRCTQVLNDVSRYLQQGVTEAHTQ